MYEICASLNLISTGLFNPSGRNQEAVRPGTDGAIPKSFWLMVATFCSFDILCLRPWLVVNYPSKTCHKVFTHFWNYWYFGHFCHVATSVCIEYSGWHPTCPSPSTEKVSREQPVTLSWSELGVGSMQPEVEACQNVGNLNKSKMCPNFMAWFRGVLYHLPRHKTQNIKRTEGGSHHLEGLWDWSMYTWSNSLLVTSTWVE